MTCLGRLRELDLNLRLGTEQALMTSTQEDGRERRDSRGGKLRGRVAVEEVLTPGRVREAPLGGWVSVWSHGDAEPETAGAPGI